jgi:hypothetical protein
MYRPNEISASDPTVNDDFSDGFPVTIVGAWLTGEPDWLPFFFGVLL